MSKIQWTQIVTLLISINITKAKNTRAVFLYQNKYKARVKEIDIEEWSEGKEFSGILDKAKAWDIFSESLGLSDL